MKLSVIILNYNVRYFLELCLQSVEVAIQNIEAEIIVIDNNSSDDSCDMVKSQFPNVRLIQNKENYGFSKGNNIGVKEAKGEYLCILNPDTVVSEDTFSSTLDFAETKENVGIIGCQLIDGRGQFLPESKRNIPKPFVSLKKLLGYSNEYYARHIESNQSGKVDILVGAFMILKKSVFNSVGGFDEDYFMYGEDIDLSYTVLKSGYDNYYFGETTIIHFKGESTLRDRDYAKRFYGAMQVFYQKHFKRNLFFNALVWLGIKIAYSIRRIKKHQKLQLKFSFLFSEGLPDRLYAKIPVPLNNSQSLLGREQENYMVIYDFNYFNVKTFVLDMKNRSIQRNIVFRFLPKNSNFILGSDNNTVQGEIIRF